MQETPFQKLKETFLPEWSGISEEFKSMLGWNNLCSSGYTFLIGETPDTGRSEVEFVLFLTNVWIATIICKVIETMYIIRMDLVLVMETSHFSWGKAEQRVVCRDTSQLILHIGWSLEPDAAGALGSWRLSQSNGHHFWRYGRAIGSLVNSNIQSKDDPLGSSALKQFCFTNVCFSWYICCF